MDEVTLRRVRKCVRSTEEELVEAELLAALWEWAGAAAVSEFQRVLLPKFRRLDRLRAAALEMLSRKHGFRFGFGYRVVSMAARQYASGLLKENEVEFGARVAYRPCPDCVAIYRRAVRKIYSGPGCCGPCAEEREELVRELNHALMARDTKRLEALEHRAGWRQGHLFEKEMKARNEVSPQRAEQLLGWVNDAEEKGSDIRQRPECVMFCEMTDALRKGFNYLGGRASKLDEWAASLEAKLKGEDISELTAYCEETGSKDLPPSRRDYAARCLEDALADAAPGAKESNDLIFREMEQGNQLTVARMLISHPLQAFSRDHSGRTPLHLAALKGWPAIVDALLIFGAKVEAKTSDSSPKEGTRQGETPLMAALKSGPVYGPLTLKERIEARKHTNCLQCARILLGSGAKADDSDDEGHSPLFQAIDSHNIKGFEMLLSAGADPGYCPNDYGFTPLHEIALNYREDRWKKTHLDMARVLLERGADPLARYSDKKWAKDWERHRKEYGIPEPEGWVASQECREDVTPLDLLEDKESDLFKLLRKAAF